MKLDDLNKRHIYKVPDGYFDDLPGKIQKRVDREKVHDAVFSWPLLLKLSVPAIAVIIFAIIWIIPDQSNIQDPKLSCEELLNQVDTEDMVSYLELQGITSDEILLNVDSDNIEKSFEGYDNGLIPEEELDDELIDAIINEYDLGV